MLNTNPRNLTRNLLTTGAALAFATAVHAVTPGQFTNTTEADFADGDAYGTVVTNLGDIKLSSDTTPLEGLPEDVTVIHDVVNIDRRRMGTFIATSPHGRVYQLKDDGFKLIAEFENEQVFTLAQHHSELLIGVSGSKSRVVMMSVVPNKPAMEVTHTIDLPEDVSYVWDIALVNLKPGNIRDFTEYIIATGPTGKVLRFNPKEGKLTTLLDTNQANILSLASGLSLARNATGFPLYAGTDTDGLVYRIDREGNPFVLYDAHEAEVSALTVMPDGTVYAGTAAADQAKPGRLAQPIKEETGRPEVETPEEEQPAEEPAEEAGNEAVAEPEGEAADDADDAEDNPAPPTPEQYDALREALKERLQAARESGQLSGDVDAANGNNRADNNAQPERPSRAKPAAPTRKKNGNAVYRIAPDGFVTEVFRESAMVFAIVPHDGKLIIATGDEGQVFSVDPQTNETTVLADLDSKQVTTATPTDQGLLLGAANPGVLMRMDTAVAEQGGYTSQVLDAGQVSIFGTFKLTADIPADTTVAIELRSGNVGDPEQAAWSKWTQPKLIAHDADANPLQPREIKLEVPPARYLQYRLTLTSDGKATPIIDQTDLAYVAPNTPPTVTKLVVTPAKVGEPGSDPDPKVTLQWQATDGNSDRLVYSLEYKPGKADRYLTLAQDLTAAKYEWQTQHVPDGWYTLRLTAHDKLDNPASSAKSGGRVSEPVLIDNTAPTLDGLKAQVQGDGSVQLTATVKDELSAITSVAYSIDGSDTYQASLPDDLIYDSTSEPWGATISDLSEGGHVIAVRAIDARGNTAYRQLIVTVE